MLTSDDYRAGKTGWTAADLMRWSVIAVLLIGATLSAIWWTARRVTERERTKWKGPALARLTGMSITNEQVRLEMDELKARSKTNEIEWAGEHVLVMTNGQYIVYEYRHGRNDWFPPHLFLARTSDGQWLYSSYHFCNSMGMIRWDNPPGSVAEFCRKYFARPFDGKSDDCLKLTW
jgi:hypothetical protein